MSQRGAAFFDLDKTLMEGSSAVHFARAAYRARMLSRRQLVADAWANLRFRLNGSTDEATEELKERILASISGQRRRDLARLGAQVLSGVLPLIYPRMLEEAYGHQDAGRPVYIVTAASQELADVLAAVLTFDGGIGMRAEVRDGVYTGRPAGPFTYREGKAEAVHELAVDQGIDLAASYAYSDSESDLPLLRAVGHPVAVNPDRALEREARDRGWRILRFDTLRRRLQLAAAAAVVALLGGGGGFIAARRGRRRNLHRSLATHLPPPVELGLGAVRARVGGARRPAGLDRARDPGRSTRSRGDGAPHRVQPAASRPPTPRRRAAARHRLPPLLARSPLVGEAHIGRRPPDHRPDPAAAGRDVHAPAVRASPRRAACPPVASGVRRVAPLPARRPRPRRPGRAGAHPPVGVRAGQLAGVGRAALAGGAGGDGAAPAGRALGRSGG